MSPDDGYGTAIDRGVSDIVCAECETAPRLKSLNKNAGTQLMCDCDDVKKSYDSVPYELAVHHLPEDWEVVEDEDEDDEPELPEDQQILTDGGNYASDSGQCPACLREADAMGVLDNGDLIYLHGTSHCLVDHDDPHGLLGPAVDQLEAHKEADS